MNTTRINSLISKEFGLTKSKSLSGSAQVCNLNGVCYSHRRIVKYGGDFHCKKYFGHTYLVKFDSEVSADLKEKIVTKLAELEELKNVKLFGNDIIFEMKKL